MNKIMLKVQVVHRDYTTVAETNDPRIVSRVISMIARQKDCNEMLPCPLCGEPDTWDGTSERSLCCDPRHEAPPLLDDYPGVYNAYASTQGKQEQESAEGAENTGEP